jgi:hypothetical protein
MWNAIRRSRLRRSFHSPAAPFRSAQGNRFLRLMLAIQPLKPSDTEFSEMSEGSEDS